MSSCVVLGSQSSCCQTRRRGGKDRKERKELFLAVLYTFSGILYERDFARSHNYPESKPIRAATAPEKSWMSYCCGWGSPLCGKTRAHHTNFSTPTMPGGNPDFTELLIDWWCNHASTFHTCMQKQLGHSLSLSLFLGMLLWSIWQSWWRWWWEMDVIFVNDPTSFCSLALFFGRNNQHKVCSISVDPLWGLLPQEGVPGVELGRRIRTWIDPLTTISPEKKERGWGKAKFLCLYGGCGSLSLDKKTALFWENCFTSHCCPRLFFWKIPSRHISHGLEPD